MNKDFETICRQCNKFNKDLSNFLDFSKLDLCVNEILALLEDVGDNINSSRIEIEKVNGSYYFFSDQHIKSACGSLMSIQSCCKLGHFSDAFVLVRKFRDDLMQYLSICYVLDNYNPIGSDMKETTTDDGLNIELFIQNAVNWLECFELELNKSNRHKLVDEWFGNTLEGNINRREFFDASKYVSFLKNNKDVEKCYNTFLKTIWSDADNLLNSYVHGNGSKYICSNTICSSNASKGERLINDIATTISNIFLCFLCFTLLITPNLCINSCITDYLEFGKEIPEDIQYGVPKRIQLFIEEHYNGETYKLKEFLGENNKYGLRFVESTKH